MAISLVVKKYQFQCLVLGLDLLVVILFLSAKSLASLMLSSLSDCITNQWGLLCPACGGTRAVFHFASGNFLKSFQYNPFFFVLILYFLFFMLMLNLEMLFRIRRAKKIRAWMIHPKTVIVFAICYAIFGIVRNLIPFPLP